MYNGYLHVNLGAKCFTRERNYRYGGKRKKREENKKFAETGARAIMTLFWKYKNAQTVIYMSTLVQNFLHAREKLPLM